MRVVSFVALVGQAWATTTASPTTAAATTAAATTAAGTTSSATAAATTAAATTAAATTSAPATTAGPPAAPTAWYTGNDTKVPYPVLTFGDSCFTTGNPMAGWAPASDCSASGVTNLGKDDSNTAQPNCAWIAQTDSAPFAAGMLMTAFGPEVAKMPGCCQAAVDLAATLWAGNTKGTYGVNTALFPKCASGECISASASGNVSAKHYLGQSIPEATYAGMMPSNAQMEKNAATLVQNNFTCYNAAVAYMNTKGYALNAGMKSFFGLWKTSTGDTYTTEIGSCPQKADHPFDQQQECSTATGQNPIAPAGKCYQYHSVPGGGAGDYYLNETSCGGTVNFTSTKRECVWRSMTAGMVGARTMNVGPMAAAIPGCCESWVQHAIMVYNGFSGPPSTCMTYGGCFNGTTLPSAAQQATAYDRLYQDNQKCRNAGASFISANTGNIGQTITAIPATMVSMLGTSLTATVNVTRRCKVGGINFGNLKVACCGLVDAARAAAGNAYSSATQALCADSACATAALTGLKNTQHTQWTAAHSAMKTVLGASTLFSATTPDACLATLPAYLTTTTTTAAPTTTSAASASATTAASGNGTTSTESDSNATTTAGPTTKVTVKASYEAVEVLPANVTAADLMASTTYRAAKKAGLVAALSVTADKLVIIGFSIATTRARRLSTANKTVTTNFRVEVADATAATTMATTITGAAAAIKTQTNAAMAAADWSGESVLTAAPTMETPTVATPVTETVTVLTAGTFSIQYFTDADCTTANTAKTTATGSIGTCPATAGTDPAVSACGLKATVCGGTDLDVDACVADGANYQQVTCSAPAAETSGAFGVGMSLMAVAGALMF